MKRLYLFFSYVVAIVSIINCSANKVIHHNVQSAIQFENQSKTKIFFGHIYIEGKIISLESDDIVFQTSNDKIVIPKTAVSKIKIDSTDYRTNALLTGFFGAYYGGFAGWLITGEMNTKNRFGHPVTAIALLGGATIGVMQGLTNKTTHVYKFENKTSIYVLHNEVGEDITPSEIKLFSVFDDLRKENEQILLVRLIQYGEKKFLLLYESVIQGEYVTKLKKIDEEYLRIQKEKINKVLSSGGN